MILKYNSQTLTNVINGMLCRYKQQQQQEAEAKKEQHRQKRQKKTAESTDHASVFV